MAGAENLALDAELLSQADVEPGRQNDEACGDLVAVRQLDRLPLRACHNIRDLGVDELGAGRDLRAHGVDERIVKNAPLRALQFLDDAAVASDPGFLVGRRRTHHGVGETGQPQRLQLRAVELFAAEIRRVDRVRIDQHGIDACAAEHGGCERAGEAATCDDNVGVPQLHLLNRQWP